MPKLLSPECLALGVRASSWEEVVRYGGRLLEEAGLVTPSYTEAMVRTVKELGTYIVIAEGIAMPHARPEDGALGVGIAIVALAEPVEFGNPDNDPVRVAVFLCAVDKEAHLAVLSSLMQLFEQEDFAEVMSNFTDKENALKYIDSILVGEA